MGLEALLAKLEGRGVTSVTPGTTSDVTPEPVPLLSCTAVTSVTGENDNTDAGAVLREALCQLFALTSREADGRPDLTESRLVVGRIFDLCERLEPIESEAIYREAAADFYRQHGRCPSCGQRGVFHLAGEG